MTATLNTDVLVSIDDIRARIEATGLDWLSVIHAATESRSTRWRIVNRPDLVGRAVRQRLLRVAAEMQAAHVPGPKQPDLDRAARKLVTALYLYPHYRVDSRGPAGCIMDALDEIAPDVTKEIRDGVEAGDIFQRRWPES